MLKPISEIKANLGIQPNGRVQKFFTNTCYNHMDKYVPMDTGDLRRVVDIKADSITYQSDYAHAQYVGVVHGTPINPENYTTPRNRSILGQKNEVGRDAKCSQRSARLYKGWSRWLILTQMWLIQLN